MIVMPSAKLLILGAGHACCQYTSKAQGEPTDEVLVEGSRTNTNGKRNPFWAFDPPGSYPVSFDRGAKINRRATELQIMARGKGLGASDAVIAIATALGNEVAAMVIRHPSLTIEEMLKLVCQSVREVAHIAAGSSPEALKGTESAQLIGDQKANSAVMQSRALNSSTVGGEHETAWMAGSSSSLEWILRSQALRRSAFTLLMANSIGLRSGEYGGR